MLKDHYSFEELVEIVRFLRSENGCPWDREQTHESMKKALIEETYEVLEAIDNKSRDGLVEELGDVLLQVLFHAQIGAEKDTFDIGDVITGISRKMIQRHTHVFGEDKADTAEDVLINWEEQKKKEKKLKSQTEALKGVPANLPALMRSYKIQQKAAQVGFDFDDIKDVFGKVEEEYQELKEAYESGDPERIHDEMGDALFAMVNLARFMKVQPELAMTSTVNKFISRFAYVEQESGKEGRRLEHMSLEEMDALWDRAKREERSGK